MKNLSPIKFNNNNYYAPGQNNVICDRCGFKMKSGQVRFMHNGLLVCDKCWEPRHPQETIRPPKKEKIVPDKVRTEPTDTYITYATRITQDDL